MAAKFVSASSQGIDFTGVPQTLNGTMVVRFKINLSSGGMFVWYSDVGASTSACELFLGSRTGAWPDESIGWQTYTGGPADILFAVRKGHYYYTDDEWHTAAIRIDGSDNAIFVDGVKETVSFFKGSSTTSNVFLKHMTNSYIFRSRTAYYSGIGDDLRIYNVGLSDSQCIAITDPTNFGNDGIVDGIQNHWRMDESSEGQSITTVQDLYGGNDGTAGNNPTYIGSPLRTLRSR